MRREDNGLGKTFLRLLVEMMVMRVIMLFFRISPAGLGSPEINEFVGGMWAYFLVHFLVG